MADCATKTHLKTIVDLSEADDAMRMAARKALAIIKDIDEEYMTDMDVKFLNDLVDEIYKNSRLELISHLKQGSPDCKICAALLDRMNFVETAQ